MYIWYIKNVYMIIFVFFFFFWVNKDAYKTKKCKQAGTRHH